MIDQASYKYINCLLTIYQIKIMTSKSEYQIALELLLNNFKSFQQRLTQYASYYNLQSKKMKDLVILWSHPMAITNLIQSLSLEKKAKYKQNSQINQGKMIDFQEDQYQRQISNIEAIDYSFNDQKKLNDADINHENENSNIKEEELQSVRDQIHQILSNNDQDYKSDREGSKNYKRGPYKSYTVQEKERAVKLLLDNELSISQISRLLKIPCKNIKRWSVEGVSRKRGGHRRSCPDMEKNVFNWIIFNNRQGAQIMMSDIQAYALSISHDTLFKASRGWMLKFIERYNLKSAYIFR